MERQGVILAIDDFHRMVHSLIGSGATYGFPKITEAARPLEISLKKILQSQQPPTDEQSKQAESQILSLKNIILSLASKD
jgi:chemotaxis protein histidine kinase CheA